MVARMGAELAQVRRDRAAFLSGDEVSASVRAEVVESWRRSSRSGVSPDTLELDVLADVGVDDELARAAVPVLERLGERLDSTRTALLLAGSRADIVARWAGDGVVAAALDAVDAFPGVCLDEGHAGTNGLGTALVLDRPTVISGAEHYAERYVGFTCAGAPVRHPARGGRLGVVTLVCRRGDTNRLMVPLVLDAVDQIQRRLLERTSPVERLLLDCYLAQRPAAGAPLLVLGRDVLLANDQAAEVLSEADHEVLRSEAPALAQRGREGRPCLVSLPGGATVAVRVERVTVGREVVGHVLELVDASVGSAVGPPEADGVLGEPVPPVWRSGPGPARHSAGAGTGGGAGNGVPLRLRWPGATGAGKGATGPADGRTGAGGGPLERLGGRSRAWQQVLVAARRHAQFELPVLVHGETGTGKLSLVRAMWAASGLPGEVEVADVALVPLRGLTTFLRALQASLHRGDGLVVLGHADLLEERAALAVGGMLDEAGRTGEARLAGTAVSAGTPTRREPGLPRALRDRLAVVAIEVPALRERAEDVGPIVDVTVRSAGARHRWLPETLDVLAAADWPGNVRQLRSLVNSMCACRPAGDIDVADLPPDLVASRCPALTRMERAEVAAIVDALREAAGNKVEAARRLGISRSTLYRKLLAYRIDPAR